eukprot:Tamp_15965.p1 GENE.Tamp_15965~~Tamp_15965.p1  ORF type:complete len:491 (+),score=94.20 Tamp_15965:36-1475(+)
MSSSEIVREKLRNIAVIAHVDHGKTTLVDKMMDQCGESSSSERFMDNLDLERERGITIMAKCTSLFWNGTKVNLVDTPGHADFGGEVERVMSMVDGVLLLVDAAEGPMAQTKFVLTKALKRGIRPIVVINKVDKDTSRVDEVESEVFDLFAFLDATEEQLDFPVLYASGRSGWADKTMDGPRSDMKALLDTIVEHVPPPQGDVDQAFSMSAVMLGSDHFLGRLLTGCVASGVARVNDPVIALNRNGEKVDSGRITKILTRQGDQGTVHLETAIAGDIVQIAGLSKATVSDTICAPDVKEAIPTLSIDPPTVCMTFGPNDSPLQGQDGKKLTSQMIWDRLVKETALPRCRRRDPPYYVPEGDSPLSLHATVLSSRVVLSFVSRHRAGVRATTPVEPGGGGIPSSGGGDLFRAHAVNDDDDDAFNQNAIANAMQDGSERGRRRGSERELGRLTERETGRELCAGEYETGDRIVLNDSCKAR